MNLVAVPSSALAAVAVVVPTTSSSTGVVASVTTTSASLLLLLGVSLVTTSLPLSLALSLVLVVHGRRVQGRGLHIPLLALPIALLLGRVAVAIVGVVIPTVAPTPSLLLARAAVIEAARAPAAVGVHDGAAVVVLARWEEVVGALQRRQVRLGLRALRRSLLLLGAATIRAATTVTVRVCSYQTKKCALMSDESPKYHASTTK